MNGHTNPLCKNCSVSNDGSKVLVVVTTDQSTEDFVLLYEDSGQTDGYGKKIWTHKNILPRPDGDTLSSDYGDTLVLSSDGNYALIGGAYAVDEGSAYIFGNM